MYDNASNFTRTGDTKDDKMYTQQMHTKDADTDGDGATRMTTHYVASPPPNCRLKNAESQQSWLAGFEATPALAGRRSGQHVKNLPMVHPSLCGQLPPQFTLKKR